MNGNLHTMVRQALAGDLGTPVAARWLWAGKTAGEALARHAATALLQLSRWLNDEVATLSASRSKNQLSVQVGFQRGGMALVTVAAVEQPEPLFELLLWAERGTVVWQGPAEEVDLAGDSSPDPLVSELARRIDHAVAPPLASTSSDRSPASFASVAAPYEVLLVAGDYTHQPGYAGAFLADGRARLIALTDEPTIDERRRMLNERLARRLNIPYIANLDDALGREDVQVVSVCAEPMRRGRIAVAAARAGKHLYLDKPLAGSVADAEAIVAATHEFHVASHMFSQIHWHPTASARRRIATGELGTITAIHFDLCFAKGHPGTADVTRPRREAAVPAEFELPDAKRELTNVGVYCVVAILSLLNRPIQRVSANTGNFFFAEHQQRDMEDFGQMLLELGGGITASVTAGRTGWQSHPSHGINRLTLVGSRGAIVLDAHHPRLETWSASAVWAPPARDPNDPPAMWAPSTDSPPQAAAKTAWTPAGATDWKVDVGHFFDALGSGQPSAVPADLAADATKVLLAAYQSAATGRTVDVTA